MLGITNGRFFTCLEEELARIAELQRKGGGGNFYLSQSARVSQRFARALVDSTLEGQTLFRDAMKVLGISKVSTLHKLAQRYQTAFHLSTCHASTERVRCLILGPSDRDSAYWTSVTL